MLCMIKKPNAKGSSQFKFSYKNATSGSNQNNGGSNEFTIDISDFDSLSWSQGSIKNGTIKIVADDTTLLNVSNNNYQSASTIAANTVDISQYGSLKITGTNIVGSYSSSGNITISEITLT